MSEVLLGIMVCTNKYCTSVINTIFILYTMVHMSGQALT